VIGVDALMLGAIAYVILEYGCRSKPASKQLHWFELVAAGVIGHSKKARGRGR
jgi:hypothetical protein